MRHIELVLPGTYYLICRTTDVGGRLGTTRVIHAGVVTTASGVIVHECVGP